MPKTEFKLKYQTVSVSDSAIPVIIVAAGNSSRMGGINKQLLKICGVPVIARTLKAFENSEYVSKIILVTKEDMILDMQGIAESYGITKLTDIVSGGDTRQKSVLCGIKRLSKEEKAVLIHDGARPFVSLEIIKNCVLAMKEYDGCVTAIPAVDTVKKVNGDGTVERTVDRKYIYLAQTPQGVRVEKYLEALSSNEEIFTDDASVLESIGVKVKTVLGDSKNIKITSKSDIVIAEGILKGET